MPIAFRLRIDGSDQNGSPANEACPCNTTLECIAHQSGANTLACITAIHSQLSNEEAWNGIGRAASANAARRGIGLNNGRRQTVIGDDSSIVMHYKHAREATRLIGFGEVDEPGVESGLAAVEAIEPMAVFQKLDI